jgi:hypothetical protein
MTNKVLWRESPSILLLAPDFIKFSGSTILIIMVFLIQKTNYLHGFMSSNRILSLLGNLMIKGGDVVLLLATVIFLVFSLVILSRIIGVSFEKYSLDGTTFHFESGVFSVVQDETQLFRILDFEVQKPFLLRLFGRGNLVIFSNDPSLENGLYTKSYLTQDGTKGMILAGIKTPEIVREIFRDQVLKVRKSRDMKTTELI